MPSRSSILVYTFTSRLDAIIEASMRAFVLGILKNQRGNSDQTWIVATTPVQGELLSGRPGVIKPRKIGAMLLSDDGEELLFQEGTMDQTLRLSVDALTP